MDAASIGSLLSRSQRLLLGTFVLILVDIIWVSTSELTKYIYHNETFEKPFFCAYVKTSMFALYLFGFLFWPPWRDYCNRPTNYMFIEPEQEDENFYSEANTSLSNPIYVPVKTPDRENLDRSSGTESDDSSIRSVRFSKLAEVRHMSESDATEALLARLSYQASLRADKMAKRAATKLPVQKVAKVALMFSLLWFLSSYLYQMAMVKSDVTVMVVSCSSSFFVLFLTALFPSNPSDKFSLSKLVAVLISISGIILVSLSNLKSETQIPLGLGISMLSAFVYAVYLVFLRKNVDHEDKIDFPIFFGFVGLFTMLLLWPLFFFLHYSNWEKFEWPTRHQLVFLLLNGLLGTVIAEVLWLWSCFLTSSLVATVSISLTIPLTMLADVILKKVSYPCLFYAGIVPMIVAFFLIILLCYYENRDPILGMFRWVYYFVCRRTRMIRFRVPEMQSEQTEALIGINSSNEHEA